MHEEAPVSATCAVSPTEIFAGEPVNASVSTQNFDPKHTLKYEWASNGGKVRGQNDTATIDTTGIAEGQNYSIAVHVTDPSNKKSLANCLASFATKRWLPSTISCLARPTSLLAKDGPVTIHCDASSPQGVAVTIRHQGNNISGQGADLTVNTAGLDPGTVTVQSTVTDTHNLTANTSTSFTIKTPPPLPPPPPPPPSLALRSIYFVTGQPTVKDPEAGLLKSQQWTLAQIADDVKKHLEVNPNAKLIIGGHSDDQERDGMRLSLRRTVVVKQFLAGHGVPAESIETRSFGAQAQLTVAYVKQSIENDPALTPEERLRIVRIVKTIVLAQNRRVDITLSIPGVASQQPVRQFPFNAEDAFMLIGGRQPAPGINPSTLAITCIANPPSVGLGEKVAINCSTTDSGGGVVTVKHESDRGHILGQGLDLSVDTSGLEIGKYTIISTARDEHHLTANCKTPFTVVKVVPHCQGLVMFWYPKDIDLSGFVRQKIDFTAVAAKYPEQLTYLKRKATENGICDGSDCERLLHDACSEPTSKKGPSQDVHIWPLKPLPPFMSSEIKGLDNLDPPNGPGQQKDFALTGYAQWYWKGEVQDDNDIILFSAKGFRDDKKPGGDLLQDEKIKLENIKRGSASSFRRFISWFNAFYTTLGILGTASVGLAIYFAKRKIEKNKEQKIEPKPSSPPQVIVVAPSRDIAEDPPPREGFRRRPWHRPRSRRP